MIRKPRKRNVYKRDIPTQDGICPICDKPFQKTYHRQKYCGGPCVGESIRQKTSGARFVIFNRDGFRCFYCGQSSFEHNIELQIDHIVPTVNGGKDHAGNLVTCCTTCNRQKTSTVLSAENEMLAEVSRRNKIAQIDDRKTIKFPWRQSE